ncbi:MAG: metal ABC transporter ATP-binding protein [Thaumarchaeota archaeon]|nr:metal ABC transporter ATP-binding protein [Nitrososphaerota archaeon]MBI3022803.1 metal ABC transporter ATP-binding protein [Nitrososphaerota archaeon]MBI3116286.1 metal ABC transporter ATP-binding protein [Nitrososphaerota archaeon]MCS4539103.1 metal ABC transporter ATP-binding protein [Nitrososphaerota archaeon]
MPAIEIENVGVRYGAFVAVSDVTVLVPAGKMIALLGPNGSGKTTILKVLSGLIKPSEGSVRVLEGKISEARGKIAYVPQREEVYWDYPLTVWDLVAMGRVRAVGPFRWVDRKDPIVRMAVEVVGMAELSDRRISDLSGGQQQRAFLARAIAQGGEIYLLDEPIAGLDAAAEAKLFIVLDFLRTSGKTIVMSTHDISTTLELFDYVLLLRNKPIAFGSPKSVLTSTNLAKAYGTERVAMHLEDVKGVAGWA